MTNKNKIGLIPFKIPHSHRGVGVSPYGPEAEFRIQSNKSKILR
jgi:hypothetical protein